jgi:large subunit ribosomal protein L19
MSSNIIERIDREQMRYDVPDFRAGDSVRVHIRIIEGNKERVQIFEGVVIRRRKGNMGATFTVRKISHGVGVEKTFALHSPRLEKVEIVSRGRVRQSRLYYLRERRGKAARIKAKDLR